MSCTVKEKLYSKDLATMCLAVMGHVYFVVMYANIYASV